MSRKCFREPIPEIFQSRELLEQAVQAHLDKDYAKAKQLFIKANNPLIKTWVESVIGKNSPYIQYRKIPNSPLSKKKEEREIIRMPTRGEKIEIHERDGYFCRFCGVPVIRPEVRNKISKIYPDEVPWGKTNASRHAAFFAMWSQYDHILPHARGGDNSHGNLVLTCTACNFGRMNYTLDEVGIAYPEITVKLDLIWNGLENFK